ncbi:hypothetical protein Barb6XT_01971 [Bacteroidales bacterium Barb6XT]|nr:hypothetical protein Barb6XT_01971 [Bacteroidales bacterium Barb6XT]
MRNSCNYKDITYIPKECKISAPHEAKQNVGFRDNDVRKVLKEQYKYKMQHINAGRSFRTYW